MGIHGLWDIVAPAGLRVSPEILSGRKLVVDASIWLIQFIKGMRYPDGSPIRNAYIYGFFWRLCRLLYYRILPIIVFDGIPPPLKKKTLYLRRTQREQGMVNLKKTAQMMLINSYKKRLLSSVKDVMKPQLILKHKPESKDDTDLEDNNLLPYDSNNNAIEADLQQASNRSSSNSRQSSEEVVIKHETLSPQKKRSSKPQDFDENDDSVDKLFSDHEDDLINEHSSRRRNYYENIPSEFRGFLSERRRLDDINIPSNILRMPAAQTNKFSFPLKGEADDNKTQNQEGLNKTNIFRRTEDFKMYQIEGPDGHTEFIELPLDSEIDPETFKSLPSKLQYQILTQVKDAWLNDSRVKALQSKEDLYVFSNVQIESYLRTVRTNKEIANVKISLANELLEKEKESMEYVQVRDHKTYIATPINVDLPGPSSGPNFYPRSLKQGLNTGNGAKPLQNQNQPSFNNKLNDPPKKRRGKKFINKTEFTPFPGLEIASLNPTELLRQSSIDIKNSEPVKNDSKFIPSPHKTFLKFENIREDELIRQDDEEIFGDLFSTSHKFCSALPPNYIPQDLNSKTSINNPTYQPPHSAYKLSEQAEDTPNSTPKSLARKFDNLNDFPTLQDDFSNFPAPDVSQSNLTNQSQSNYTAQNSTFDLSAYNLVIANTDVGPSTYVSRVDDQDDDFDDCEVDISTSEDKPIQVSTDAIEWNPSFLNPDTINNLPLSSITSTNHVLPNDMNEYFIINSINASRQSNLKTLDSSFNSPEIAPLNPDQLYNHQQAIFPTQEGNIPVKPQSDILISNLDKIEDKILDNNSDQSTNYITPLSSHIGAEDKHTMFTNMLEPVSNEQDSILLTNTSSISDIVIPHIDNQAQNYCSMLNSASVYTPPLFTNVNHSIPGYDEAYKQLNSDYHVYNTAFKPILTENSPSSYIFHEPSTLEQENTQIIPHTPSTSIYNAAKSKDISHEILLAKEYVETNQETSHRESHDPHFSPIFTEILIEPQSPSHTPPVGSDQGTTTLKAHSPKVSPIEQVSEIQISTQGQAHNIIPSEDLVSFSAHTIEAYNQAAHPPPPENLPDSYFQPENNTYPYPISLKDMGSKFFQFDDWEDLEQQFEEEKNYLKGEFAKLQRNTENITDEMEDEVRELLSAFGIPYVNAPAEAEAQCAVMNQMGLVDGDDSDSLAFGSVQVFRNFFESNKTVEMYELNEIKRKLGLSRDDILLLAELLGCDYTVGVHGVGVVNAFETIKAFPSFGDMHKFRKWAESPWQGVDEESDTLLQKAYKDAHKNFRFNWRFPDDFPSEDVIEAFLYPQVDPSNEQFSWGKPNLEKIIGIVSNKTTIPISEIQETISQINKRLMDKEGMKTQLRIDKMFKYKPKSDDPVATIKSKRMLKALETIKPSETNSRLPTSKNSPKKANAARKTKLTAPNKEKNNTTKRRAKFVDNKTTENIALDDLANLDF